MPRGVASALAQQDLSPKGVVEGVIVASGAGMDLTDASPDALGDDPGYYGRRFSSTGPGWKKAASPRATSVRAGAPHRVVRGPGQSHERMVLVLSRDDGPAGSAMLRFIRRQARPPAEVSRPAGAR